MPSTYLNIKPNVLSNWIKRNTYDAELIYTKCDFINANWLLTGEGEMLQTEKKEENLPIAIKNESGIPLIPTNAFAGLASENPPIKEGDVLDRYTIPDFVSVDFMIRVKGDSMVPRYNSGDIVACRMVTDSSYMQWNRVHIISTRDQGVMIKRVKQCKEDPKCLLVTSENKDYDPFKIPKDQILNIALVVGSIGLE